MLGGGFGRTEVTVILIKQFKEQVNIEMQN